MHSLRWLLLPVLLFSLLGCGLISGVQQAANQLPAALSAMPTMMGAVGTMSAGQPPAGNPASSAGGLGISLDDIKKIQSSGHYSFSDTTENGQPVSTAVLTAVARNDAPGVGDGFSARFIGSPANLSQIVVTAPATQDAATAFAEIGLFGDVLSTGLPMDVRPTFIPWLTQSYTSASVGKDQQTTIQNLKFTLKETKTEVTLQVDPAQ